MAEEERPEHISAGVRRLLQEAMQLGKALDLVVATQGSGSPAVAPLVRELTGTHRVLSAAFAESTAAPLLTTARHSEPEVQESERVEDRLEQTEARLAALRTSIAQLLQRLERKETPTRQQEDAAADLKSRNTELESEIARHRDIEISLLTTMREIRSASQAKSDFLANMSHELRTPLNAIIGFAEIMETELIGPLGSEQYVGYAKDVRESGQYLLDLINDILDLSKIESGQLARIIHGGDWIFARRTVPAGLTAIFEAGFQNGLEVEVRGSSGNACRVVQGPWAAIRPAIEIMALR